MNRITIRRFDIVRTANIVAAIYVVLGLFFGLLFLPVALLGAVGTRSSAGGALLGGFLLFFVFGILFYAIAGWIFGAISAAVYNFVASRIGGLRLDVINEGPLGGGGVPMPGYPSPYAPAGYPAPVPNAYPPGYAPAPTPQPGPGWPGGGPPAPPA